MKKIIFRQIKLSDLEAIYQWVKEIEKEDTYITLNAAEPVSVKEQKEYLKDLSKKIKQKKAVSLAVFSGKKYLGSCDIVRQGKRQGHIGLFGIALSKECRGQGKGFKLAQEVIKKAKERLGLKKIILSCFANNQVGLKFYQKLGFKQYGRLPRAEQYQGKFIDSILFYKDLE